MTSRPAGNSASGFTLLELLISLAIFALILVALSNGLHFAGRAWDQQQQRDVRQGDVNAVQNVLQTMIASGRNFEGDKTSMKFVGALPMALEKAGLFDITLDLEGGGLLLSWRPHFKGPSAPLAGNQAELLKGVTDLDINYYLAQGSWQHSVDGNYRPHYWLRLGCALGTAGCGRR